MERGSGVKNDKVVDDMCWDPQRVLRLVFAEMSRNE
jgi:hypothetical protein